MFTFILRFNFFNIGQASSFTLQLHVELARSSCWREFDLIATLARPGPAICNFRRRGICSMTWMIS